MRAAGVVLVLLGLGLALRAGLLLSGRGRPRRGPRPVFVLAGPYLRLRNPLFLGGLIAWAGTALAVRSWWLGSAALVAAIALHLWVTRVEEPRLRGRFGTAYTEYLRRVPRWLPRRRVRGAASGDAA
jgi:protein-S-isoprenylcysteine O-methyltransferase Ste14